MDQHESSQNRLAAADVPFELAVLGMSFNRYLKAKATGQSFQRLSTPDADKKAVLPADI